LLREVAELTWLSARVTAVVADTHRGRWIHTPGVVFADLVAAVVDRADCGRVAQLWGADCWRRRGVLFWCYRMD
jgi:hypothetical protein